MVGGIVVDVFQMGLQNVVGLKWWLWQSVGLLLAVVGWHTAGWLSAAMGHCSFGMWLC